MSSRLRIFALIAAMLMSIVSVLWSADASEPAEVVQHFLASLQLGTPRQHRSVIIVPLRAADAASGVETLSEALATRSLSIHEIGEGRVNQLEVENTGKLPVFIMAGQILVGAKQNRVLQHDVLLPPMSGRVTVEAFCVQHGRWSYEDGARKFSRSDNVSNPQVRQAAAVSKAQTAVWASVDDTRRAAGVGGEAGRSDTSDLNGVYESATMKRKLGGMEEAFRDLPQRVPDMQGAIVIVDGEVAAVDVFGDRAVFRRLWRPLLASYVLDGLRVEKRGATDAARTARAFLAAARRAETRRVATPGSGTLLELIGEDLRGHALAGGRLSRSVIHLDLFPTGRGAMEGDEPPIYRPRR
jgi:hypothetical protein